MFGQVYEIMGITPEMLNEWKDYMRKDIIAWEQDGIVHAHIYLNPLQALWMKIQIYRNNKKTEPHYCFKLARVS